MQYLRLNLEVAVKAEEIIELAEVLARELSEHSQQLSKFMDVLVVELTQRPDKSELGFNAGTFYLYFLRLARAKRSPSEAERLVYLLPQISECLFLLPYPEFHKELVKICSVGNRVINQRVQRLSPPIH